MTHLAATAISNGFAPSASTREAGLASNVSGAASVATDVVRIRKYPNRRLYDTSRSRHLTHEGVVALVREGRTVQVTDSRSGADITNVVLLQILIERDPAKLQAFPSVLLHRVMRSEATDIRAVAERALAAWRASASEPSPRPATSPSADHQTAKVGANGATNGWSTVTSGSLAGRVKAKAKRIEP